MPQSCVDSNSKKKKGRAPAHQNIFAFRHNPKSKKTATILAAPIEHCCQRCYDKLEWRKRYRKYKPLTQPSTCNICRNRNITAAYHTVCDSCSIKSTKAINLLSAWNTPAINTKATEDDNVTSDKDGNNDGGNADASIDEETQQKSTLGDDDGIISDGGERIVHRRVCTICFKAPAIPASDDESSDDDDVGNAKRLRLRNVKSLARLKEREEALKRQRRRHDKQSPGHDVGEGDEQIDNDTDEGEENSDIDEDQLNDSELVSKLRIDDDSDDDPFLKAVGGKDMLVVGEEYQQKILKGQEDLRQTPPISG